MQSLSNPPIIVAKGDERDILMSIAIRVQNVDQIKIHAKDAYLPKVDKIVRMVRRFGWVEKGRGKVSSSNPVCLYCQNKICANEKSVHHNQHCNAAKRQICGQYSKKFKGSFEVNEIIIEPIAGIRSMD